MIKQYFETIAQYNKELKELYKKTKQEHRMTFHNTELCFGALHWGYKNYLVSPLLQDDKEGFWYFSGNFDHV